MNSFQYKISTIYPAALFAVWGCYARAQSNCCKNTFQLKMTGIYFGNLCINRPCCSYVDIKSGLLPTADYPSTY